MFLFDAKNSLNARGLNTLSFPIGYTPNFDFGRVGLFSNPPPQFGQTFSKIFSTHVVQNVHSKVQIIASFDSFGKDFPQFSQHGLISNMDSLLFSLLKFFQ